MNYIFISFIPPGFAHWEYSIVHITMDLKQVGKTHEDLAGGTCLIWRNLLP